MKNLVRIVLLSVIIVFPVGCQKAEQPTKPKTLASSNNPRPEELVQERDRSKLRVLWFQDAKAIAEKSGDTQAYQVVNFLFEHGILAQPDVQGMRFMETGHQNWFALVPLIIGDDQVGAEWAKHYSLFDSGGIAHFFPDMRLLILKSHIRTSPVWRGIVTLHEGNHAREFITRRYDWKDARQFCIEERNTHEFQNRVTEKIGGEPYRTFVNLLADEINSKIRAKGKQTGEIILHRDREYPELDAIFGPAESELERAFRGTSVWIHANFILLERAFKESAPERKALFLKTLYARKEILPH